MWGPISSWEIDGETVSDFILGGSKIAADGDCSHEIKTLAPWKKSYDKLRQHMKEQRHHFAHKGAYSQSYGFSSSSVWMWELDHKKADHQRIDAFELWCWRRLLRIPWTSRRSKQSILKEISSEYSLERLVLKLKLQCFGSWCKEQTHWKDPDAEKDWGQEKGTTEDEMSGWHQLTRWNEFE